MTDTAPPLHERRLAKLTVAARTAYLAPAAGLARAIGAAEGLAGRDLDRLEVMVDEACTNVVEHAFEPGEEGEIDVVILRRPGEIAVRVEDRGLPYDLAAAGGGRGGVGVRLMRTFADEVRFVNLGMGGKRVEMILRLPARHVDDFLTDADRPHAPDAAPSDEPVELRLMRPDDAVALARCVYRTYGYTYPGDFVYYPDQLGERLARGLVISAVAVTAGGEVAGHVSFRRDRPDARVGDLGQAFVIPSMRARGLLTKLVGIMFDHLAALGMCGAYAEAVSVHPYSQKAILSYGARETGFVAGLIPAGINFKKIRNADLPGRQSVVLYYRRVAAEAHRELFPPLHHAGIIGRIVQHCGLNRTVRVPAAASDLPLSAHASLDVTVAPPARFAQITVREFGGDLAAQVRARLRELCLDQVEAVFLDLPLCRPGTARACASLEAAGFDFAGIVPELLDTGDALRLVYLNNVPLDFDRVQIESPFGRELFDYARAGIEPPASPAKETT